MVRLQPHRKHIADGLHYDRLAFEFTLSRKRAKPAVASATKG
jgi:hypothetical protein